MHPYDPGLAPNGKVTEACKVTFLESPDIESIVPEAK